MPGGCPAEEAAVLAAVADLGYPVERVAITYSGFPCGGPFPQPPSLTVPGCPALPGSGPTAYVTFVGTAKEAALTITYRTDGSLVAYVVAFQVPPWGLRLLEPASPTTADVPMPAFGHRAGARGLDPADHGWLIAGGHWRTLAQV